MIPKPPSRASERKTKLTMRKQMERAVYRAVNQRDGLRCRACGQEANPSATDMTRHGHHHHVRFRSAGGPTTTGNIVLLCSSCHSDCHAYRLLIKGDANGTLKIRKESA